MAIIGNVTKQPADNIDYDVDCTALVEGGDSVASVVATASPVGLDVSAVAVNAKRVKVWLDNGTAGTAYKVEITVTTILGRIKQDEIKVRVKEY